MVTASEAMTSTSSLLITVVDQPGATDTSASKLGADNEISEPVDVKVVLPVLVIDTSPPADTVTSVATITPSVAAPVLDTSSVAPLVTVAAPVLDMSSEAPLVTAADAALVRLTDASLVTDTPRGAPRRPRTATTHRRHTLKSVREKNLNFRDCGGGIHRKSIFFGHFIVFTFESHAYSPAEDV